MYIDRMYEQPILQITQDREPVPTLLICRNGLVHRGLQHLLNGTGFAVSNTACDETSPLPCLARALPVLVLVYENPHDQSAVDVIRHVKAQCPHAKVVVLAERFEPGAVLACYAAGADGWCPASSSREVLVTALELVMLGQAVVPHEVVLALLDEVSSRRETGSMRPPAVAGTGAPDPLVRKLSSREADILRCLMRGEPNKVIARNLDMAEATVKVHVKAILRKIGAGNRTQAAIWATEHLPTGDRASA